MSTWTIQGASIPITYGDETIVLDNNINATSKIFLQIDDATNSVPLAVCITSRNISNHSISVRFLGVGGGSSTQTINLSVLISG